MLGGGNYNRVFQCMALGPLISMANKDGKKMGLLMHKPKVEDINYLLDLITAGKIKPVIEKVYSLEEVPEAIRYFGQGLTKGKLVITT